MGLSGGPWFVVGKDVKKNIIYLAQGYDPKEVYGRSFSVINLNWIAPNFRSQIGRRPRAMPDGVSDFRLEVKIRHGKSSHPCTIKSEGGQIHVQLKKPAHGIAPGQFAVFYDGDVCLGGGMIV